MMINVHLADPAMNNWLAVKLIDLLIRHDVQQMFYVGTLHLPEANFPEAYCTSAHTCASAWDRGWTIEDSFISALVHFACVSEIDITLLVTKSFQRFGDMERQQAIDTLVAVLKDDSFKFRNRRRHDQEAPNGDGIRTILFPKETNVDNFLLYK